MLYFYTLSLHTTLLYYWWKHAISTGCHISSFRVCSRELRCVTCHRKRGTVNRACAIEHRGKRSRHTDSGGEVSTQGEVSIRVGCIISILWTVNHILIKAYLCNKNAFICVRLLNLKSYGYILKLFLFSLTHLLFMVWIIKQTALTGTRRIKCNSTKEKFVMHYCTNLRSICK